jgi:hypothetical protein
MALVAFIFLHCPPLPALAERCLPSSRCAVQWPPRQRCVVLTCVHCKQTRDKGMSGGECVCLDAVMRVHPQDMLVLGEVARPAHVVQQV